MVNLLEGGEHKFNITDDYEALALANQDIDYRAYYRKYIPQVSPLVQAIVKELFELRHALKDCENALESGGHTIYKSEE